jgi:hypothetical protein
MRAVLLILVVLALVWGVASYTDPALAEGAFVVLKSKHLKLFVLLCLFGGLLYALIRRI